MAVDATDANTVSKVVARDASGNFSAGTITASLTGNVTGTVSDVSNHDTDDITEGSTNLYYTAARFNTAFSGKSTSDLSEGTNLYYTNARADARVAAATGVNLDLTNQDTDDLSEGSTNLYRSEEHTSELQSRLHLVCRLLLEKKKTKTKKKNKKNPKKKKKTLISQQI